MQHSNINRSIVQFDKWSKTYDASIWSLYFSRAIKFVLLNSFKAKRHHVVLDLGCGTGNLCFTLAATWPNRKIIGVDASPEMINVAKSKDTEGKVDFIVGVSDKIPVPDKSVDIVYCLNSFHHYPDHDNVLKEIKRILSHNGSLVILDPIGDGFLRKIWSYLLKKIFNEPYAKFFTSSQLSLKLEKEGFKKIDQRTFWYFIGFFNYRVNA